MATQLTNNAAESATYSYNGGTPYITLSGTALNGYQSLLSLATNDSWTDGDFIWIFIREDANKWSIWKSVWDETNERLLSSGGTIEEESGTLTDSATVSIYGVVSKGTLAEQYREKLTADRTYYVRTDGNDSNTGLANTSGGAFLTIQAAIDTVANTLDTGGFNITIQVADGTYTGAVVGKPLIGAGKITIKGNNSTPANVHLNVTGTAVSVAEPQTYLKIIDCKITGSSIGISAYPFGMVEFGNIVFGASSAYHIRAAYHGHVNCLSSYTIAGSATEHVLTSAGGTARIFSVTVTISGTPAFTEFVKASGAGYINLSGNTYSGSATGSRYSAVLNGIIETNSATLPGNSAGSTATGGQYS